MKPSLPQGTRDFGPEVVRKRQYILNTIKAVFELYGFQPLETPAMENLETLMGKYGEEGDKLIFKVLNNGLGDAKNIEKSKAAFENALQGKNDKNLTERALKYDLTIPFARYVAMNHGQLTFPFKRYQIQPVWRADRPQRGRYREFYQCDADVVGSKSLLNEVELTNIYHQAFTQLGIKNYELRINSRKILTGLAERVKAAEKFLEITIALDKFDKIGLKGVEEELRKIGLDEGDVVFITNGFLFISTHPNTNQERLRQLRVLFQKVPIALEGIDEIEYVLNHGNDNKTIVVDTTLARGLNYYTGIIFEAKAPAEVKIGSIGGGGRYDDLTGLFGVPNVPGVGISFGVDRIYDVMEDLKLFPETVEKGTKVLFFNLGDEEAKTTYRLLQEVRSAGVPAEIFHEAQKFDKQFKYAEKKNIPFIIIIGSAEVAEQTAVVKDLRSGQQQKLPFEKLKEFLFI
ncbi:histidine--tRNA ligase [Flavisolibacter ginsenosidimutans]|uniref:Histidine--tRNA ligase n=1 Tax=Flavisolibacter ginsenosidimutans TaxID=661481 RepID=A0A5B8UIP2_9BACT|nr:histidine--tRNA ligase [Flavisolibacter ginsenosidimutans]QEC56551.1 histidine--tRNA ligase [Flavisolibacter ginsenosidimutans]